MANQYEGKTASNQLTGKVIKNTITTTGVKVTVPNTLKASVKSTPVAKTGSILDVGWAAAQIIANKTTFGLVPLSGGNNASTAPKTLSVNVKNTPARDLAITTITNALQGKAIRASPNFSKVMTTVNTKMEINKINNAGLELAPKGTVAAVYNADQQASIWQESYNAMSLQNESLVNRQTEYQNQLANIQQTLAQGTIDYSVAQGKLDLLNTQYSDLQTRYDALANSGGGGGTVDTSLFGGLSDFINKYGLWIAIGVGALLFMPLLTKLIPDRK